MNNFPFDYRKTPDGKLEIETDLGRKQLEHYLIVDGQLIVEIYSVHGHITVHKDLGLKTLKGFPEYVDGHLDLVNNTNLKSYEFGPTGIRGYLDLTGTQIYKLPEDLECRNIYYGFKCFRNAVEFNEHFAEKFEYQQIIQKTKNLLEMCHTL